MAEMAPDDENSLGPDLDPPTEVFPDTPRGNLLRQIDQSEQATATARSIEQQYRRIAETAESNTLQLRQQLAELDAITPSD